MRIALFHNYYALPGGEDQVFEIEREALAQQGHEVFSFEVRNEEVFSQASPLQKAAHAWAARYSKASYEKIRAFLDSVKADVGHVHNWFPILSPSIYQAHKDLGVPVVQTLHNYRIGCANGTYRLDNASCSLCRPSNNWNAVKNRCYRGSLYGTLAWKRMVDRGWSRKVFSDDVSHYVCPSHEIARRHMEMGIPKEKMSIIPNACRDNLPQSSGSPTTGSSFNVVFIGRMVPEKGVDTLINAWGKTARARPVQQKRNLTLIGDGPEVVRLYELADSDMTIHFTGQLEHSVAMKQVLASTALVFPSRWAEPFGLGIIEAMAAGKPVIASNIGGPAEIVKDGVTGILVQPDCPKALAQALEQLENNPQQVREMGKAAREKYLSQYTPLAHANALTNLFASLKTQVTVASA